MALFMDTGPYHQNYRNSPNKIFDLWVLMDHVRSTISRSREMELAVYGLTPEQGAVLDTLLENNGSATITEIAESVVRKYNSVSTLVSRMVKAGLVKKKKAPDGKKFNVSITDRGRTLYQKIPRHSIEMAFSDLTAEERRMLDQLLNKLLERNRKLLGMDFKPPFLSS
jgi:DNA-binding MarR family transcriptional regulator